MYSPEALRNIIRIALQPITATRHPLYTPDAEEQIMMIAAHESKLGRYLLQLGGGPGRGVCQVEISTMRDNFTNFINQRHSLAQQIRDISGCPGPAIDYLTYNPIFNIIMARIWLYRRPGALPPAHDVPAMAAYARAHYNVSGEASEEEYANDYMRLVLA